MFRLISNRNSARKCRQKKKAEFSNIKENYEKEMRENENLKLEVSTFLLTSLVEQN